MSDPTCVVHACTRPVSELGQLCDVHFQGLDVVQRRQLVWGAGRSVDPRVGVVVELEGLLALPAYGEGEATA